MYKFYYLLFVSLVAFPIKLVAQNATLVGVVFDSSNIALQASNITYDNGGTITDETGFYKLNIPSGRAVTVTFSHIGYKSLSATFSLKPNEILEFNPALKINVEQMSNVIITSDSRERITGLTTIDPETVRKIPGANPGVENLLQTLPGVSSNNELSTQYAVRGGNYDENLIYINDIEVYRPFLIRSGQQEGLSIVNNDLIRDIKFSAGGFQAKYGDKFKEHIAFPIGLYT